MANGNIKHLERRGRMQSGSYGVVDNLTIAYNGNQLQTVTDGADKVTYAGSLDFKGAKNTSYSYTYNGNGSLLTDKSRGIAFISYDLSGNPQKIYFTNGSITKYVYSATGQKLRMVHYTAKANISRAIGQQVELKASEIQSTDSTDYLLGGSLVVRKARSTSTSSTAATPRRRPAARRTSSRSTTRTRTIWARCVRR